MKEKDFTCEGCRARSTRLSLSARNGKWICPGCALAEKKEASLNERQIEHLEKQLVERKQLVRRREQAQLNFGHAPAG